MGSDTGLTLSTSGPQDRLTNYSHPQTWPYDATYFADGCMRSLARSLRVPDASSGSVRTVFRATLSDRSEDESAESRTSLIVE